jgi:branched-chain amino acid aminotransferase
MRYDWARLPFITVTGEIMTQVSEFILAFVLTPDDLTPAPYHVKSLAEAVSYEPQGVYTVARTFHGDQALLLAAHLDRLEQSARLMHIPLKLDRARLRSALRELLHDAGYPDSKFRITVPQANPDHVYLALEPYHPVPESILRQGASLITTPLVRENPIIKTTAWMLIRYPTISTLPSGTYEAILVSEDGRLLEGLSSNFYGVLDGVLYTAQDGVLEGITRRAVLELVPDILPVELTALRKQDVPRLSEAMITSSGRGVVPVTMIDGNPVGDGRVGPVITAIRQGYEAWTEAHIDPI